MSTRLDIYNIPLLALIVILVASKVSAENIIFMVVCYAWPWALVNKNLAERYQQKNLRLSCLGIIFRIERWLQTWPGQRYSFWPYLTRNLVPLTFVLLVMLLARQGNLLFALLGTLSFEGFTYLLKKFPGAK